MLSRDCKPRVLVVVAHFDDTRNPDGRPNFIPQGLGHAYLAGAFHHQNVDVRIYSEFHSGRKIFQPPLELASVNAVMKCCQRFANENR